MLHKRTQSDQSNIQQIQQVRQIQQIRQVRHAQNIRRSRAGKSVVCALLAAFLCASVVTPAWADRQVRVTLPTFPVTINGVAVDNSRSQYPLIVYQGITYFPMTYHASRFLNLKANWYENRKIFFVGKADDAERETTLTVEQAAAPNKSSYTATIPDYQIAVNTLEYNEFLDNGKEEYPVLNFRDVTYFPLTWRFAVEEFGWSYSFDDANGLVIDSGDMFIRKNFGKYPINIII